MDVIGKASTMQITSANITLANQRQAVQRYEKREEL
jgi:hypothetical protein